MSGIIYVEKIIKVQEEIVNIMLKVFIIILRSIIRYGKDNGYTFEVITMDTLMVRQRVNN